MNPLSLQIAFRHDQPMAAYIHLPREPGDVARRTSEPTPGLRVDYAADDRPIGIEIHSPGTVTVAQIRQLFHRLGLAPIAEAHLTPLVAG